VPRLLDLGVPDYLVAATVEGVLAQRLVRRVCANCRVPYRPNPESVALLAGRPVGRVTLFRGAGCPECRGTGFRGRVGVFELMLVSEAVKGAVVARASQAELRSLAAREGMRPLRSEGWAKVEAGLTTVEEVLRVVSE